jgi:DNA ligase-4
MNFGILCDFFDNVRHTKGTSEKTKLTKTFIGALRDQQQDLFPVLRLIIPKLDRDRPSYRIKESKISKLLIKMLGLPHGNDQNVLLKAITGTSSGVDFGDVVYSVLKKYVINKDAGLTIQNINTYLDQIAHRKTDNGLDDLVLNIFRKLSPRNIKWLIQIILKDLKLGISDNHVLNCYHDDGADFYATNSNLKRMCEVLRNPQVKMHELEINIFEPFRPMLSKRCDASNFKKCFPDSKFIVENKFDGERFQLHMEDGKFKYFSRNGFDFTDSYGATFDEGIFTPLLKNVFDSATKRVILDGEMMLWNKKTKCFGSKGMKLDVKKLGEGKYQPCFCVFDVLLHNERVLTNHPLQKRLQVLKNVIKNPVAGTIVVSAYTESQSRQDIVDALNSSIDKNEEGIVVKDPKSVYKCSDRNSGWFKVKMEYFDDVVHDLDVIMMGGCYGANNKINSFFVGVSSGRDTYFSLGKIHSGLNDEQLDMLNDKLKTHGIDFKQFSSKSMNFGKDTPDLYVEPQNACVLQIRATELIRTTNDSVKCPYTLRFPRVLTIREDKPVDECLTMNDLLELTQQNKSVIKLNKRHIELDEIMAKGKKSKRIKLEVVSLEQPKNAGDFLKGKKFYVDSGTETWAVEEIYHSIKKLGGVVSYRLEPDLDVVLIGKVTTKIADLLKKINRFDIIHVDWLRRAMKERKWVDYHQSELFGWGANYRRDTCTNLDEYGIPYAEEVTETSLQHMLRMMEQRDEFYSTNGAVVMGTAQPSFDQYVAYFDKFEKINDPTSKRIYHAFSDEIDFQYYDGTVSKEITPEVNVIVMGKGCDSRRALLEEFLKKKGLSEVKIVMRDDFLSSILKNASTCN